MQFVKRGFCRIQIVRREAFKADRGMMTVVFDWGVDKVNVGASTSNKLHFRCAPGLGANASDNHCAFGRDCVNAPLHDEVFPKGCKEHTNANGDKGR